MLKVKIIPFDAASFYDFYLYDEGFNGERSIAKPIDPIFVRVEEASTMNIEPTLRLSVINGESLIDTLLSEITRMGKKPESIHKLEGVLEAQQKHLQDLQKLIFEKRIKG